jgi:hypothetical protein
MIGGEIFYQKRRTLHFLKGDKISPLQIYRINPWFRRSDERQQDSRIREKKRCENIVLPYGSVLTPFSENNLKIFGVFCEKML